MTTSDRDHLLTPRTLSRRALLQAASATGIALPLGLLGESRPKAAEPKAIKLGWFPNAACLSPIAAAVKYGIFTKHNLDVELINFAGSTDQLLEAISTAKADASVGMALRWLKPLEQGFDVRITAGTHGGCLRLLGAKGAQITEIEHLRGKTVAVSDLASPAKNFFSILLSKRGIDPVKDVDWRAYPSDLLAVAVEKGEAQAIAHQDPDTYRFLKGGKLVEVATNLSAEYAHRTCCVLGIRGSLLREDRPTAAALTRALLEAQDLTAAHPEQTAEAYAQYVANSSAEDIINILKSHTHGEHVLGASLRGQIVQYAEELKLVSVIKQSTDPVKFAEKITEDVLA
jgi:NitT/TauT family transport system substrate-binding protein